ncbi:uncharacterized protein EDB91DRAFT_1346297 [Suillus paluster]|uniref:uncharacterized protein n=1 Tax=Suillus paluster TaxID=48578 RepID=UPI001B86D7D0|nr:uncharacterized protein EDB91DRAFT_1346297 [Suillus paluster]KAG1743201.1 hypothetical protein EDB91DRAFT_1346297 [Suillus paluster]
MSTSSEAQIISDALEVFQTVAVGFFGFTILVWDHVITFADEVRLCSSAGALANPPQVEIIWGRPKNFLAYLFLLNRYLTPLGFILNLVAYLPSLSFIRCEHFVRYEGAMTAIGIEVVALMMFLRVRAMYRDNIYVVGLVASLWFAWVAVDAWLLTHGEAVPHSLYTESCGMEFSVSVTALASAWAWVPLCYDTVVFALTFNRTFSGIKNREAGHIVRALFADGVLFYSVMCAINLIFTIMVVRAPPGLKYITGQLELILPVTIMSRITLSLKKECLGGPTSLTTHSQSRSPLCFDCERSVPDVLELQPLGCSSQNSSARSQLSRMRGHTEALEGAVSSQGQRDDQVRICFACPAAADVFEVLDDEHSRYQEPITSTMIDVHRSIE